jgi:hypothetical protein
MSSAIRGFAHSVFDTSKITFRRNFRRKYIYVDHIIIEFAQRHFEILHNCVLNFASQLHLRMAAGPPSVSVLQRHRLVRQRAQFFAAAMRRVRRRSPVPSSSSGSSTESSESSESSSSDSSSSSGSDSSRYRPHLRCSLCFPSGALCTDAIWGCVEQLLFLFRLQQFLRFRDVLRLQVCSVYVYALLCRRWGWCWRWVFESVYFGWGAQWGSVAPPGEEAAYRPRRQDPGFHGRAGS